MGSPWAVHGTPIGSPSTRVAYGLVTGRPWAAPGQFMDIPRAAQGQSIPKGSR